MSCVRFGNLNRIKKLITINEIFLINCKNQEMTVLQMSEIFVTSLRMHPLKCFNQPLLQYSRFLKHKITTFILNIETLEARNDTDKLRGGVKKLWGGFALLKLNSKTIEIKGQPSQKLTNMFT